MDDGRDDGWDASAQAWLDEQGEAGDFARRHVLDAPMLARVRFGGFGRALDVGCGEGRFCRLMAAEGVETVGVDPTEALLAAARARDPGGCYVSGRAEALPFEAASFDLVVSYLTFIDIADIAAAIGEMARVLRPGGALLIANLNPWQTAANPDGWRNEPDGARWLRIDRYLEERSDRVAWRGVSIVNWHRPMSRYVTLLLGAGLTLTHFDEPAPTGGPPAQAARNRCAPFFHVMEWRKPRR